MEQFVIDGRLSGLNEYTLACRSNRYAGNSMKRKNQNIIAEAIKEQKVAPVKGAVKIVFDWCEQNKRRDLDNVAFAKKFILDALTENGIIESDGWKTVVGFEDYFHIDKEYPRIIVTIKEW